MLDIQLPNCQVNTAQDSDIFTHDGLDFALHPYVFSPKKNDSSAFFAQGLISQNLTGSLIEIGSGCGLVGLTVTEKCRLTSLTATDINPFAVLCTRENSERLGLGDRVSVYEGDVYDPIPAQKAHAIFWNAPWVSRGRLKQGHVELTRVQRSFFDPGYQGLKKYISLARDYLVPDGRLFLGFGKGANTDGMFHIAREHGYEPCVIRKKQDETKGNVSKYILYELKRPSTKKTQRGNLLETPAFAG